MPTVRPHRVAALVLPSVVPFDLGVAVQVFGYPRPDLGRLRYTLTVCGAKPGLVPTSGGFSIAVTRGLGALRNAETIVVPGIDDLSLPVPEPVARALQRAHERGVRLVSICTGAFVLAAAGVLDGRRATTHWLDAPALAERYPAVAVDPGVLYVDEGSVLTSAGITAGVDLCVHVVRKDYGAAVANAVARRLVVAPHRAGGQAQFVVEPVSLERGTALESARRWAAERLAQPLTVRQMAARAGMSMRTFARRFAAETGTSPLQWLLRQRLLAAQQLLENTDHPVERVAGECGFGSAVSLRVHFRREFRTSPLAYRRAFRRSREAGRGERAAAPRRTAASRTLHAGPKSINL
ncbi:MAG TPA: helix-turn-helix domain-containing protein [Gemmatimonadaceae bacterium]|jgi:transcriptional regulator GlxA family with amidase domain|nr:helix-turn-helix domain-containing protein [Gemmatimonadaceae bacterium]